jgi:hypothetical protein
VRVDLVAAYGELFSESQHVGREPLAKDPPRLKPLGPLERESAELGNVVQTAVSSFKRLLELAHMFCHVRWRRRKSAKHFHTDVAQTCVESFNPTQMTVVRVDEAGLASD